MKRAFVTRAVAGLALLAVALGAVAFQAKEADAQTPFVTAGGPYVGTAGVPVQFGAASNVGPVASVHWTFGDGSSARGFTALKTFGAPGVYSVSVTVTNIVGQSFTANTTATISGVVTPLAPNCQYTTPTFGTVLVGTQTVVVGSANDYGLRATVVCNAVSPVVPGTVVISPYCYNIWLQYGYFPAWVAGCR